MTERESKIAANAAALMSAVRAIDGDMTWDSLQNMTIKEFISLCSDSDKGRLVLTHEELEDDEVEEEEEEDDGDGPWCIFRGYNGPAMKCDPNCYLRVFDHGKYEWVTRKSGMATTFIHKASAAATLAQFFREDGSWRHSKGYYVRPLVEKY